MKINVVATLIAFILLSPLYGFCQLEGHGVMDESINGIRLYQRPVIKIPEGWQEQEEAGQELECLVLVPKKEKKVSETMIYAMAIHKDKPGQSLSSFIEDDIAHFKTNNKKGLVKEADPLKTVKGLVKVYEFSYPYKEKHFNQAVAYAEDGEYFVTFTLTGKSPAAYKMGKAAFALVLSSYK